MEIWHYWIIAGIVLLILEIFTPGFLLASFGIGAFAGSAAAYFGLGLKYQLLVFSLTSLIVFFGIRPAYKKYFGRFDDQRKTGTDALVGKSCKVAESIDNDSGEGRVRIGGELWKACSQDGSLIDRGDIVIVTKIEGATAYVAKKREEQ